MIERAFLPLVGILGTVTGLVVGHAIWGDWLWQTVARVCG